MADPMDQPLQAYLAEKFTGAVVSDVQFLVSGFESDVYTFTLRQVGCSPKSYVLRLYPGDGSKEKMTREARGLDLLNQAGYPVPAMLLYEPDASHLGSPFTILEKLEGEPLWPVLAGADPERVNHLLDRFGSLLSRLHQLDWRPFTGQAAVYAAHPAAVVEDWFASSRQLFTKYDVGGFLSILDWLEDHRSEIDFQPAVVHLDFHANNVFLCRDDRLVVIDWTQITVADYRAD